MITAKEAKELYDLSGQEIADYLKYTVEKEVVKAAKGGKRQTIIHLASLETFRHLDQVITPLQKGVVARLNELGYRTEIKLYDVPYIPNALVDDGGHGPLHQNFGIVISW